MTPKSNLNSTAELFKRYKINKMYFLVEVLVTTLFSWTLHKILSELNLQSYITVGVPVLVATFIIISSFLKRRKKVEKTKKEEKSMIKFSK